ncbi:MAG: ATP-binding protein, partial [Nitrososphaeraceae archaeon]
TTKDPGKGTGLGLSISHRIITETHQGDIRVSSRPGETRFQVRLPIIYKDGLKERYWSWIKPQE